VPFVYEVLKQSPGDPTVIDAYAELANALRNAPVNNQSATAQRRGP